jgi:phosphohistidine swiveling domain-containing protein
VSRDAEWVVGHEGEWGFYASETTVQALRDHAGPASGCLFETCVIVGRGNRFHVFFRQAEVARQRAYVRELLRNPEWMAALQAAATAAERRVREFWQGRAWGRDTPSAELADLLTESDRETGVLLAHYQVSSSHSSHEAGETIRQLCAGQTFSSHDVLQCLLAADTRGLDSSRERAAWLRLCEWWLDGGARSGEREPLVRHAEAYRHLGYGLGMRMDSIFAVEALAERIRLTTAASVATLRAEVASRAAAAERCDEVAAACAKRLRLPSDLFAACRAIAALSVARMSQRETLHFNTSHRAPLMDEILRRLELALERPVRGRARFMLSKEEIHAFLRAGTVPDLRATRPRAQHSLFVLADRVIRIDTGAAAVRRQRELDVPGDAPTDDLALVGTPVAGARAGFGRAIVVPVGHEVVPSDGAEDAFEGAVVVTATVRPFMVPFCRRASAIVTEEGGVTSHAAVVARELRIPCIVGVTGATRRVRTGDPLFVSVRTGKVRQLSPERLAKLTRAQAARSVTSTRPPPDGPGSARSPRGPPLVRLGAPEARDPRCVGGKAAALADIAHLAPPGIVLTTAGVRTLLRTNGDSSLHRRLATAMAELGWERLAVRSSHVAENAANRSYAGLFQSVLDVAAADVPQCIRAIRRVADSVHGAHVVRYVAAPNGRSAAPAASMAVILQGMVDAVVSGVLLTSLRRQRKQWLIIEYVAGPLTALMDGARTPFRSACCRDSFRHPPAAADLMPPLVGGGVAPHAVDELLRIGVDLERRLGVPQEIEWAVDAAGRVWILQARSLGSVSTAPAPETRGPELRPC